MRTHPSVIFLLAATLAAALPISISWAQQADTSQHMESTDELYTAPQTQPQTRTHIQTKGTVVDFPERASQAKSVPARLPTKGMSMTQVTRDWGPPVTQHQAVGKPPITRWDYDGFHVFFEHNLVLHSVVPHQPPEIHHQDQLGIADK